MAPSQKRKRKATLKCPCPCCSAVLSEKTIERHLGGTHLPTRIEVTRTAASSHKRWCPEVISVSNPSSDLSSDSSDLSSDSSDAESTQTGAFEIRVGMIELEQPHIEPDTVNDIVNDSQVRSDTEEDALEQIVQESWSGHHSRVDDYESDTEAEDFNEDSALPRQIKGGDSDSDLDSEFEWKDTGMHNGLELDDLIDEDLQRIIAEFGVLTLIVSKVVISLIILLFSRRAF